MSEDKIPVFIINFDICLSWLFFIHLNFEKDCIKDFILITEFFWWPLKIWARGKGLTCLTLALALGCIRKDCAPHLEKPSPTSATGVVESMGPGECQQTCALGCVGGAWTSEAPSKWIWRTIFKAKLTPRPGGTITFCS